MNLQQRLENLARFTLAEAKKRGATACDVRISSGKNVQVQARNGEPNVNSGGKGAGIKIRVFIGTKVASCSPATLTQRELRRAIRDVVNEAKNMDGDPNAQLPDPSFQAKEIPDLDLFDPNVAKITVDQQMKLALAAEKAALNVDQRITTSLGASCSLSNQTTVYATSEGFFGAFSQSSVSLSVVVLGSDGKNKQTGYWWSASRKADGLDSPESIGLEAARRTLRELGGSIVPYQKVPVVFDPSMTEALIGKLAAAVHGEAIFQKRSFLAGRLGQTVASSKLTLVDDPHIKGALGSMPFGEEGLALRRRVIIGAGKLENYLVDAYAARMLKVEPNGGGETTNWYIEAGTQTPAEIIAMVPDGLYLTGVSGMGVNLITGDYSLGASGIWIKDGKLAGPVQGITIASTLQDMLTGVEAVGNDLDLMRGLQPTILIREMTVGGVEVPTEVPAE